jgi:hypothetical protein
MLRRHIDLDADIVLGAMNASKDLGGGPMYDFYATDWV